MKFCQKLDLPHPLDNDWKMFAAELGMSMHQIKVIENMGHKSNMEYILTLLETRVIDLDKVGRLPDLLFNIKRPDCVLLLSDHEPGVTCSYCM